MSDNLTVPNGPYPECDNCLEKAWNRGADLLPGGLIGTMLPLVKGEYHPATGGTDYRMIWKCSHCGRVVE